MNDQWNVLIRKLAMINFVESLLLRFDVLIVYQVYSKNYTDLNKQVYTLTLTQSKLFAHWKRIDKLR